jgi:ABC-type bacteriocin/lantibiotic exporter with double-glycine peptidase domain
MNARSRRWIVPEVVQTSATDCGPAALKAVFAGFGRELGYGRLREACQTDVDGTSIDTLEEVSCALGVPAEQVMVPWDFLLRPESQSVPCIAVLKQPDDTMHFVVVWRCHGRVVQVMDPGVGRVWISNRRLLDHLFVHRMPVPAEAWREYAGSAGFRGPLAAALRELGVRRAEAEAWIDQALARDGWCAISALDAITRCVGDLVASRTVRRGRPAVRMVASLLEQGRHAPERVLELVPSIYWTATPHEDDEALVDFKGTVVVRFAERPHAQPLDDATPGDTSPVLSPELAAALDEPPVRVARRLLAALEHEGRRVLPLLGLAAVVSALGAVVQALVFRGVIDFGHWLGVGEQRLLAALGVLAFTMALLLLELPMVGETFRAGRHLEARFRIAFMRKLPRLREQYIDSRLISDLAHRCHGLAVVRDAVATGVGLVQAGAALLLTAAGVVWIHPASAPWVGLLVAANVLLPLLLYPVLAEQDLKLRTLAGGLSRFYLDSMLGLMAIRAHGAEASLRTEHRAISVEWARAAYGHARTNTLLEGLLALVGLGTSVLLVTRYVVEAPDVGSMLLLVYWVLDIPVRGSAFAIALRQYPRYRNSALRVIELLDAPEEREHPPEPDERRSGMGARIELCEVGVREHGHDILHDVSLRIDPGTHVGIVGASGAGKSTLVGLLLGFHRPMCGRVHVDGRPLDAGEVERLRRRTVWVDPGVTLWNESLLDNLRYGSDPGVLPLEAVRDAELDDVLARLPEGLQSSLGEGGRCLSGGEGQRVRLGRGLARRSPDLVILDEAFRGLSSAQRTRLLERVRERWRASTMLCVTHDVAVTLGLDRVLVIDGGRVVEQGTPSQLLAGAGPRYAELLADYERTQQQLWRGPGWRRVRVDAGSIVEHPGEVTA